MRFCNNCGTAITEEGLKFCPGCGTPLEAQAAPVTQSSMANRTSAAETVEPVVAPAATPAPVAPASDGQSMFWHETVSKKLMNVAAIVLIILGVLMWTGGIYQHVVFRMSEEGRIARMALSLVQGEYNDVIEEPSGLFDDFSYNGISVPKEAATQADTQGEQFAEMIDDADVSFTSDYLYEQYGFMRFVDIIFGALMIFLGLFAFYVGQNLSQYKRDSLQMFELYNVAVLGAVVLYGILYNFVLSPFSDVIEIFTLPYFVIVLGLVASYLFNKEYYAKRNHMFTM